MKSKFVLITSAAVLIIVVVMLCCKFLIPPPPLPEISVYLESFSYDSETSGHIICTVSNISQNEDAIAEFDPNSIIMLKVDQEVRLYQVEAVTLKPGETFTAELSIEQLETGKDKHDIMVTAKTKSGVEMSCSRPVMALEISHASTRLWASLERVEKGTSPNEFLWTLENWSDEAWLFAENRVMQIQINAVPLDYPTESVTLTKGEIFSKVFRVDNPDPSGEMVMTVMATTENGTKIVLETILR